MKRHELIELCLTDAAKGDMHSIAGLLDYLIKDCNVQPERLIDIGVKRFGIPEIICIDLLSYVQFQAIH